MILSENQRPHSDGHKSKEDKTSSLKVDPISQYLPTSREPYLNLRTSSSLEVIKLLSLEIKDNNSTEDCFSSNTKLKDF
jgi:hypothetical protein